MNLFDVKKYQVPNVQDIDLKATKKNFEIFMTQYGAIREKVGKNRLPKMTQSFNPIAAVSHSEYDGDAQRFMIEREQYISEFRELENIFICGYYAIANPSRSGGTERRRQIFMLRYIYGIDVVSVEERTFLGRTKVIEESKLALIQFCHGVGLLIMNDETNSKILNNLS